MPGSEKVKVGIVALGLIGGSIAQALSCHKDFYVTGFSHEQNTLHHAWADRSIDEGYLIPKIGSENWEAAILEVDPLFLQDILILCTPVEWVGALAQVVGAKSQAILTDVGSVKSPIMEACRNLRFIGGHPMAGSERTGYACATESLFENAQYVLCAGEHIEDEEREVLEKLVRALGAKPLWLDAYRHDDLVARVSHLPHAVAAALMHAALPDEASSSLAVLLSAGGFRDITRIASSDPDLWAGISLESGAHLLRAVHAMQEQLQQLEVALEKQDEDFLRMFYARANHTRAVIPAKGIGPLISDAQILINIEDKTGALAALTQLLSEAKINIHNISIQDARQYEGGHVRLFISSPGEAIRAIALLKEAGYDVEG